MATKPRIRDTAMSQDMSTWRNRRDAYETAYARNCFQDPHDLRAAGGILLHLKTIHVKKECGPFAFTGVFVKHLHKSPAVLQEGIQFTAERRKCSIEFCRPRKPGGVVNRVSFEIG